MREHIVVEDVLLESTFPVLLDVGPTERLRMPVYQTGEWRPARLLERGGCGGGSQIN